MGKFRIVTADDADASKYHFSGTSIDGVKVVAPEVYGDDRGYFMETYEKNEYTELGIDCEFVQDNQSKSSKGVLRGLHFQKKFPQAKLVRVVRGAVFDVAVDLRKDSATFGKWFGVVLSEENNWQLFIPRGFAHGFVVLSDDGAVFAYKVDDFYHPDDEGGIYYGDKDVAVKWPVDFSSFELVLSEKDQKQGSLEDFKKEFGGF